MMVGSSRGWIPYGDNFLLYDPGFFSWYKVKYSAIILEFEVQSEH